MSHCKACDRLLSDFESTRKITYEDNSVEYLDLCNRCFKTVGDEISVVERSDLATEDDVSEEFDEDTTPYEEHTWSYEDDEE